MDPLDGTREFLARNGQFTVNIALIEGHAPVLGVVHVPVSDTSLPGVARRRCLAASRQRAARADPRAGAGRGPGARGRQPLAPRRLARCVSRASRAAFELKPIGSSLKFCLVAEGSADVYPRLGPTSEWDTAAAHAVAAAAGAGVVHA